MRLLMQETRLSSSDMMYPIFVDRRISKREEVESMPGIYRLPLSSLEDEISTVTDLKIPAILLFGLPRTQRCDR